MRDALPFLERSLPEVGSEMSPPMDFGHGVSLQLYQVQGEVIGQDAARHAHGPLPSLVLGARPNGVDTGQSDLLSVILSWTQKQAAEIHALSDGRKLLYFPAANLKQALRALEAPIKELGGMARLGLHDLNLAHGEYVSNQWRPTSIEIRAESQIGGDHYTAVDGPVPLKAGLYPVRIGDGEEQPALIIRSVADGPEGLNPPHRGTKQALKTLETAAAAGEGVQTYFGNIGQKGLSLVLTGNLRNAWNGISGKLHGAHLPDMTGRYLADYEKHKGTDHTAFLWRLSKAMVIQARRPSPQPLRPHPVVEQDVRVGLELSTT